MAMASWMLPLPMILFQFKRIALSFMSRRLITYEMYSAPMHEMLFFERLIMMTEPIF